MNSLSQMVFYAVNSISFPSYQGGGVEKGCVSIFLNSLVIPRFHGPELGFLVKDKKVIILKLFFF